MRVTDYTKEIQETLEELQSHLKQLQHPKLRSRCEVLVWLKNGEVDTMKQAMVLKGLRTNQGYRWWKQYKAEGLTGFLSLGYKPQASPLKGKQELVDKLSGDGFATIKEARDWIATTYGIVYTENGLGNYFRRKGIKLKTARPHHPKKDEQVRKVYKKKI